MSYYWKDGFYLEGLHEIPSGAIALTDDQYRQLVAAQAEGYELKTGEDGRPVAALPNPAEVRPGLDYERRGDAWVKIRFTKKEFLLLCGLPKVAALNVAIKDNPLLAAVHDILMASEFIDLTDPATIDLVGLLATPQGGSILSAEEAAAILAGVPHEEN